MSNVFIKAEPLINPLNSGGAQIDTISEFVISILGIAMYIGIPLIGLLIVYAGFKFLFARGNAHKIKRASFNFMWLLIGIGIFLGAWTLSTIIDVTIGDILK